MQFMRLLAGKWVVAALATAAKLGLAEHLETPKTAVELATELGLHAPSLERLLGVLAGEGLLDVSDDTFVLNELGANLRKNKLGELAAFVGSESQWTPWLCLDHSIRTGQAAFEHRHGSSLFEYLARHPQESAIYDRAVDAFTRQQAHALADAKILQGASVVVDVGGGRGSFLLELLRRESALHGVLYDLPHVIAGARARFVDAGLGQRAELVEGDFFESVPSGADCYVVKHVLHNWDDEHARRILRNCAKAMKPGGKVLIVEGLILPAPFRDGTRLLDLEMLALTGQGRERSKPEFRRLLATSDLRLTESIRLSDTAWLLCATPK
jgi:ubiquinone/menaquinone biosynthesis C-methylase UbiE